MIIIDSLSLLRVTSKGLYFDASFHRAGAPCATMSWAEANSLAKWWWPWNGIGSAKEEQKRHRRNSQTINHVCCILLYHFKWPKNHVFETLTRETSMREGWKKVMAWKVRTIIALICDSCWGKSIPCRFWPGDVKPDFSCLVLSAGSWTELNCSCVFLVLL